MPSFADVTATVRDSTGAVIPAPTVVFTVADPTIASLTVLSPTTVRVTGLARGVTYVVATSGSVSSNVCIVYVEDPAVPGPLPAVSVQVVPQVGVTAPGPANTGTPSPTVTAWTTLDPTVT